MRQTLRSVRTEKRYTVTEIAKKLNISASFYYKIEQGSRNPTIELAKRLAGILNNSIDILFFDSKLDESSNYSNTNQTIHQTNPN